MEHNIKFYKSRATAISGYNFQHPLSSVNRFLSFNYAIRKHILELNIQGLQGHVHPVQPQHCVRRECNQLASRLPTPPPHDLYGVEKDTAYARRPAARHKREHKIVLSCREYARRPRRAEGYQVCVLLYNGVREKLCALSSIAKALFKDEGQ